MVHLNCHSFYSLLGGVSSVETLVQAVSKLGFPALALTDTNATYGAVAFQRAALQVGIRPIFGAEINDPKTAYTRAVLLAKDLEGFGEICRVVTDRQLNETFDLADRLKRCSNHVIILCPDLRIVDAVASERGSRDLGIEHTLWGNVKEEIQRWEFSKKHHVPLVASNRVFFIDPKDWETHRLLVAIRLNTNVKAVPRSETVHPEAWLKSHKEMAQIYWGCPQAIQNTRRVAEQCDMTLPIGTLKYPPFALPHGESHSSCLRKLAWEGIGKLYPVITPTVRKRLQYELDIVDRKNFCSYFLLVWDIVREAHKRGILTVGRGSAANSLVCRVLGITEVDPIRHNLYFERFLNEERTDFPDIDIDFPWNRRDEMIQYVFDTYGHENVALISSHIHLRGRSTLREAGKALGISAFDIDAFTSNLPYSIELANLEKIRDEVPECRGLPLEDEPYRSLIDIAQKIEGIPRHISIHCGGIVVSPSPITNLIPLQRTPKGFAVTQFDMYPVEDLGLLKIDLLAQKGLAVEIDTVQTIKETSGKEIDFSRMGISYFSNLLQLKMNDLRRSLHRQPRESQRQSGGNGWQNWKKDNAGLWGQF